ncbi:hypothetical protein CEXT_497641 [Caerostris extrusa]|uniref:Uncharacterized protein n=1 Tax=Caerostris extrusa TaxID=172846 RepID=A0AAV4XU35_CAEEX|nr:hypothetical protein CEXT_497641 [Caerostris extrusa]
MEIVMTCSNVSEAKWPGGEPLIQHSQRGAVVCNFKRKDFIAQAARGSRDAWHGCEQAGTQPTVDSGLTAPVQ